MLRRYGLITKQLNSAANVHVFYTTYKSPADPNYYDNNEFKDSLAKLVTQIQPSFVIDLHASNSSRSYGIDFGTMYDKSYRNKKTWVDKLIFFLLSSGINNLSKDVFPAQTNQTITKFLHNKNVPVIQLEINSVFLHPEVDDIHAEKTASLL